MRFKTDDGGRREAGWKGKNAGDCAPRAIAIALGLQYRDVRSALDRLTKEMTGGFDTTTNNGTTAPVYHRFLTSKGWSPVLTKGAYLKDIPKDGAHIAVLSGHVTAVLNGTVHDAWDSRLCRRTKCGSPKLLGYYTRNPL